MVTIRPCRPEDLPAVSALFERWVAEEITYGLAAEPEPALHAALGPYFLVADASGVIVGFAYGHVGESEGMAVIPTGERYFELDNAYVAPEHRSGSIGRQLVDGLLGEASRQGVERSLLYSATRDWQRVVRFYEQCGFKMWFVQMYR